MALALSLADTTTTAPAKKLINMDAIRTLVIKQATTGSDTLLPGASLLPTSVGSKFTVKNLLIGGGIVVAAYLGWTMLGPKKKPSGSAPSPAAKAVAGLFGYKPRRRRRR